MISMYMPPDNSRGAYFYERGHYLAMEVVYQSIHNAHYLVVYSLYRASTLFWMRPRSVVSDRSFHEPGDGPIMLLISPFNFDDL